MLFFKNILTHYVTKMVAKLNGHAGDKTNVLTPKNVKIF